jgi:hypothetical protein
VKVGGLGGRVTEGSFSGPVHTTHDTRRLGRRGSKGSQTAAAPFVRLRCSQALIATISCESCDMRSSVKRRGTWCGTHVSSVRSASASRENGFSLAEAGDDRFQLSSAEDRKQGDFHYAPNSRYTE